MPGMNGDVVIAKIKKIYSEYALFKNYLPYICILSSLAENSDEIRSAVKAGADVYSSKPADQEFIRWAYKTAIEKQKKNWHKRQSMIKNLNSAFTSNVYFFF